MNKWNKNILFSTSLLQGLIFFIPVSTIYLQSRGVTLNQILMSEAVLTVLLMVVNIPAGIFADRFGCKKTLILAWLCSFIAKILYFYINGFPMLLLSRAFDAFGIAAAAGTESAMVYATAGREQSQKMFGRYYALNSLGILIASLSSTFIISVSMDLAVLLSVISYGLVVIFTLFLKEVKITRDSTAVSTDIKHRLYDSFQYLIQNKKIVYLIISYALLNGILLCISQVLNQQQYVRCKIDIRYFGIIYVVIQVVALLSDKIAVITDSIGQKNTLLIMYLIPIIGCFVCISTVTAFVVPFMVLMCSVYLLMAPVFNDVENKLTTGNNKVTILSIYSTIVSGTTALIMLAVSRLVEISLALTFCACGGLLLVGIGFFLAFYFSKEAAASANYKVVAEN